MLVTSEFAALNASILLIVSLIVLLSIREVAGRWWLVAAIGIQLLLYGLVVFASSERFLGFLMDHGAKLIGLVWIGTWVALMYFLRSRPFIERSDK